MVDLPSFTSSAYGSCFDYGQLQGLCSCGRLCVHKLIRLSPKSPSASLSPHFVDEATRVQTLICGICNPGPGRSRKSLGPTGFQTRSGWRPVGASKTSEVDDFRLRPVPWDRSQHLGWRAGRGLTGPTNVSRISGSSSLLSWPTTARAPLGPIDGQIDPFGNQTLTPETARHNS